MSDHAITLSSLAGEAIILGSGASAGTPVIGCPCTVCHSPDPRNRRTRASTVVKIAGQTLLIDTSPDLRLQALREGIHHLDAVLYTHPHADHLNGIDDLRAYCFHSRAAIPVFGNRFTIDNILERFGYACLPPGKYWDKPVLTPQAVDSPFQFQGLTITPIPLIHGPWEIFGWRIGNFAYLTDLNQLPESSLALLQGLDVLFLDCLREEPYPSHLGFGQALELAAVIGARQTVLIHMTHQMEYQDMLNRCPPSVVPGYDGLRLAFA